jgi:subtilase family serine protease
MNRKLVLAALAIFLVALILAFRHTSSVRAAQEDRNKRILIVGPIDENTLVRLGGNTRPEANAANDRGPVNDGFPMEHMLLQLKRAPEQEAALEEYISELSDKSSPNYHHWLTPAQLGETYGPSQADIERVTAWLESYGFTVNYRYPSGMVMDFSGTAGQIHDAFHTEIHYLDVHGKTHYANMSDPEIPLALAPVVVGIVSMHDFAPRSMAVPRTNFTFSGCGGTCYALVPGDIGTIYNFNPLFAQNILGQGQTIAVIEDSDTYSDDPAVYRSTFLSRYSGAETATHPNSGGNCTDPGTNAADAEADLDAEIAAAAAPDATIEVASCADTSTFGGLIAVENLVNAGSPPAIISMSYGECEVVSGATSNAAFSSAFQSAAASGVSVFVAAGDAGASLCAPDFFAGASTWAYPGVGVTGWGESAYNVSVGGTDYEDTYNADEGGAPVSTYWESTNTPADGSAKSYIPEIPWNDSCASWLIMHLEGYGTSYGSTGFCNSTTATTKDAFLTTAAGSGGPSGCATGTSANPGQALVNGSCAGYLKPSWQAGIFGNPADGVRDVPDVALFAGNGIWGHYAVVCFSDTSNGGTSCRGTPSTWAGFGGTSVATPMMAGIQALVNQKTGVAEGNPDPIYYQIANAEFGSSGNSVCYSVNQVSRRGVASDCVFYDVTQGDNNVNCMYNGTIHEGCYRPSGTNGALATQAITGGTVVTAGSGYTSTPTCTFAAPNNLTAYLSPTGGTIYAGGTQATCTAAISATSKTVTGITLVNAGAGYQGNPVCTLSGGGGSGATCRGQITDTTAPGSYQPAFGATPGWDFATGIGTVNAYNLVYSPYW